MAHTLSPLRENANRAAAARFTRFSPKGEVLLGDLSERNSVISYSPQIQRRIAEAESHYKAMGAEKVFRHSLAVLKAAAEAKLIDPKADERDQLSMRVVEQILYHSFVSESYLPFSATFSRGFLEAFDIQRSLNALDGTPGERMDAYVRLLNNPSTDVTALLVALYTRIADMMTVHDQQTLEAAAQVKMPGVFHVRSNWSETTAAMADPMLRVYCPIADWGGHTYSYRQMRDNAMLYMHREYFGEVAQEARKYARSLAATNQLMMGVLQELSVSLGVSLVVAHDYRTISEAFGEVGDNTLAVAIKPFKGVGGLLHKMLQKGIPIQKVHDWTGLTVISSTADQMYSVVEYLYEKGVRSVSSAMGVRDLHICPPTDYAADPKPVTNYQSVHVDALSSGKDMLPAEFIVRTLDMHMKADEGAASHDRYKRSPLVNGERQRFMQRLAEMRAAA
jgi:Region found in RelA / SpoT proteins